MNCDGNLDIVTGSGGLFYYQGTGQTSVEPETPQTLPQEIIMAVYPNPFNQQASLKLTIADKSFSPGEYSFTVKGDGLASGVYFISVHVNKCGKAEKVVLVK